MEFLPRDVKLLAELDRKTRQSTRFAVLVLREESKPAAREHFHTPLVFSVQEAKGLEYETVILFDFVSSERRSFAEIAGDLAAQDVDAGELAYSRAADKADKSLDLYKFFVNALYVAVTRGGQQRLHHRIRHFAPAARGCSGSAARASGSISPSTSPPTQEWQYEAHRLEQQGKVEQAEEVRRSLLRQQSGAMDGARRARAGRAS